MLDLTTYLPKLKEFEGVYSYMYLDTAEKVTVGVGQLLPNAEAAQKLAFVLRASANPPVLARPATPDEIRADFDNVSQQPGGRTASFYKEFTKLDLPDSAIDAVLEAKIEEITKQLCIAFPDFTSYPAEACAAILDMGYNLGVEKLTTAFPSFSRAVRARDWATAAQECERRGPGPDRNNWTKAQLETAASAVKAAHA